MEYPVILGQAPVQVFRQHGQLLVGHFDISIRANALDHLQGEGTGE